MRGYVKKRLLIKIAELQETNKMVGNAVRKAADSIPERAWSECQQAAIQIGNIIEAVEGKEAGAVKLLEEYCEVIYQQSQAVLIPAKMDALILRADILLGEVAENIRNKIKDLKKIVFFLPYKASMWDSMESIWLSSREDKECECYVMPIPYFDKNPDGTLAEMHYEGEVFPEYVPITDWRAFDLNEVHPDAIYIHNPYDQYNYVTTVHPTFYSAELSKCTDMLVYVPYFITLEDIGEHFCELPGVFRANKVILQSEKIKEVYKKVFIREVGMEQKRREERGAPVDQSYWNRIELIAEDKFIALGSPKVDRIANMGNEKVPVPEKWDSIIEGKNGRRKVFLYNTHVNSLMKDNGYQYLKKMKQVLQVFKQREDAVLLWRPHPLSEATIEAMNPDIYMEYQKILQEFKAGRHGILDDTSDFYTALSIADAYIGDESSITVLFGMTGKPILIQNPEVCDEKYLEKYRRISLFDYAEDNGKMWFWEWEKNALFERDCASRQVRRLGEYMDEGGNGKPLYGRIIKYGDKIICVPMKAEKVAIYDLQKGQYRWISLKEALVKEGTSCKTTFLGAVTYKNWVFVVGHRCSLVVKIDMQSERIDSVIDLYSGMEKRNIAIYFTKSVECVGNIMYIPAVEDNVIFQVNMDTMDYDKAFIDGIPGGFSGMYIEGNDVWLTRKQGQTLIKWDRESNAVKRYSLCIEGHNVTGDIEYSEIISSEGYLWIFPYHSDYVIKMEIDTGTVTSVAKLNDWYDLSHTVRNSIRYSMVKKITGGIRAFARFQNQMLDFDCSSSDIVAETYYISKEDCDIYIAQHREEVFERRKKEGGEKSSYELKESADVSLEDFIERVFSEESYSYGQSQFFLKINNCSENKSGGQIYNYIKNLL